MLPEGGDIYTVVGQHGSTYTVDAREGRCTCPDAEYNLDPDEACKHELRTLVATGDLAIPEWAERDLVDDHLGEHVDGERHVVAADGGTEIVDASDEGQILDEDDDLDVRPDDCQCAPFLGELPCWPCFRDGFDSPATEEGDQ